jgi:hypothetical protein
MTQNSSAGSSEARLEPKDALDHLAQRVEQGILAELSSTPYACSKLTLLPSGTTNFVFRGTVRRPFVLPLEDDDHFVDAEQPYRTVIVKLIEGFARLNPAIKIDSLRGVGRLWS